MSVSAKKIFPVLFLIILILLNLVVYWPALLHPARSDQNFFLIETLDDSALIPLIAKTYSYTRTRKYAKGDELQFKPLYFIILAVQRWLFGMDFVLWQAFSLILHLGVVWLLYRLLNKIKPHHMAVLLALLFSVCHISQDMVIWHHINPLFFCLIFMLLALKKIAGCFIQARYEPNLVYAIALGLGIACFIHEYAVLMILVILLMAHVYARIFPSGQ